MLSERIKLSDAATISRDYQVWLHFGNETRRMSVNGQFVTSTLDFLDEKKVKSTGGMTNIVLIRKL